MNRPTSMGTLSAPVWDHVLDGLEFGNYTVRRFLGGPPFLGRGTRRVAPNDGLYSLVRKRTRRSTTLPYGLHKAILCKNQLLERERALWWVDWEAIAGVALVLSPCKDHVQKPIGLPARLVNSRINIKLAHCNSGPWLVHVSGIQALFVPLNRVIRGETFLWGVLCYT